VATSHIAIPGASHTDLLGRFSSRFINIYSPNSARFEIILPALIRRKHSLGRSVPRLKLGTRGRGKTERDKTGLFSPLSD
jgi:hypothetical protein